MSEEYCVGVKILLERMDTNPEEFMSPIHTMKGAKWSNLMSGIIAHKLEKEIRGDANFLTEAEVDVVFEKYKVLRRKQFDDHVMREVLGADEELSPRALLTTQAMTEQSLRILQDQIAKSKFIAEQDSYK